MDFPSVALGMLLLFGDCLATKYFVIFAGLVMPNYRRNFVVGGCYFFTVNMLERQRTLLTDHIDLLRDSFRVTGYVKAVRWVE